MIGVRKYVRIEGGREGYKGGIRDLGENGLDGLKEKKECVGSDIKLHLIGCLQ
ncbi:hypothetical protein [Staphylococcus epidermidis]|uniref:hypothetical protein n=1 Tax=Staphylococcus epidermidis TaxID=1282 RepID=UPI00164330CB|nr:hypothetical protein [Staphylococcus epidermidis]